MSDNLGLGFSPVPQKLPVSKKFSLSMNAPPYLIEGEEIVLEVDIINHLEQDIKVIIMLSQTKAFKFVMEKKEGVSVINAQTLTIGSHASASVLFPIRPVVLGEMEISVDAISEEASDSIVWSLIVKPKGVEQFFSETLFLELGPTMQNSSRSVSFFFPPDVVPGSQWASVALVGDILALSISNLDSLVQVPIGCGEQSMIHFAPSIYILQYLNKSAHDNSEIRSKALTRMMEAYWRQLSFQRDDGSFSACGASDRSGSTWLTAFVLRCFLQARSYIPIDYSVLARAMAWLLNHQGPGGEFSEVGRLIHTEMQEGLDNGPVALTSFVLITMLEDESFVEMYAKNISLAQSYLENKVSIGVVSNYSLCLVAYALSLTKSPTSYKALTELTNRADHIDGVMMWRSSVGRNSHSQHVNSVQIEMASYMLLTLFKHANFAEGIALLKWLSKQRNYLGGYGTTQDTVVALEALACYASFSGAFAIDLRINISAPAYSYTSLFTINSNTYQMYHNQMINADKDLKLNVYMEGRGFALFQMNVFYNLESKAYEQSNAIDKEDLFLAVDVINEQDLNRMLLTICMRLKDSQAIPRTGMAILDVGILSGFRLSAEAALPTDLVRKVETWPGNVILYLDSLNKSEVCIRLPVIREYNVAHVQDAVVQVYDYYQPLRRAARTYNLDVLYNRDVCSFCGVNCSQCRSEITVMSSHSLSSTTTYSLTLLFLGITTLFIVV
uniref:CD109 antigen-like n=1 Tax=Monopterus albus TaxID=43700 RepID=UPI0009B44C72|nr:CD109 antigen-like [Monopterus albus]